VLTRTREREREKERDLVDEKNLPIYDRASENEAKQGARSTMSVELTARPPLNPDAYDKLQVRCGRLLVLYADFSCVCCCCLDAGLYTRRLICSDRWLTRSACSTRWLLHVYRLLVAILSHFLASTTDF
jgi:hypothetical protein